MTEPVAEPLAPSPHKRLSILWIARTCPLPANDGEKQRVFNLLKALAQWHDLTVVCRLIEPEEQAGLQALRGICKAVHAVQIPRPRGWLDRLRWAAPFVLSRYPLSLCTVYFEPIRRLLQEVVDASVFDIIQVEHSSLSIYLDRLRLRGRPATILTMHNIDYLRSARVLANQRPGLRWLYMKLDSIKFRAWELAALKRFDHVITMSQLDRSLLLVDSPPLKVSVVPNGVDAATVPYAAPLPSSERVVFVASMDSDANHDGAMFLMQDIWPLVKAKRPAARLIIVGRGPRPALRSLHNGQDIVVTGKVGEVLSFYRDAAVAVVPLRSGGGTRLKILEAMAAGIPVVTTTVGCEGIEVKAGVHALFADDPAAFAAAVVRLMDEPALALRLSAAAREFVERVYDWGVIAVGHDALYRQAAQRADA